MTYRAFLAVYMLQFMLSGAAIGALAHVVVR
jgi:hypothetical protein